MNNPPIRVCPEFNETLNKLKLEWGIHSKADLTFQIDKLMKNLEVTIEENKKTKIIKVKSFPIKLLQ